MDGARRAVLGQKFGPWEAGPDHQERIAALHQFPTWLRAQQPDGAGYKRKIVRQDVLSEQCLRDTRTQEVCHLGQLRRGAARTGADQNSYLAAGIEDVRRTRQVGIFGHDLRLAIADSRAREAMCNRRLRVVLVLNVLGQDQDGGTVFCLGYPDASIDQMPHLSRRGGFLREDRDIRKHAVEVEFLLIAGAPDGCFGLTAYRQNWRVVQFGVVQARDQVGGARTAGGQADPDLAGEFGMGHRHEGGHLFVPDLDEFDRIGPLQRPDHAVDAIAGITVNAADTPSVQAFNDEIADFHEEAPVVAVIGTNKTCTGL